MSEDNLVIDFAKDNDEQIIGKVDKLIGQSETLYNKKLREYKVADAYFNGRPDLASSGKMPLISNKLFPIIRNMVGLTSDPRPHPSAKLGRMPEETPQEIVKQKLELANDVEKSLDEWWEDHQMQSSLQKTLLSLYTYADFFWMPYWSVEKNDVCIELLSPRRIYLDPNNDNVGESDYAVVVFYRSRAKMYEQFGEEKCKDLKYSDYKETIDVEGAYDGNIGSSSGAGSTVTQIHANVCKVLLYMDKGWWVYKVDKQIIDKTRCPFWAADLATQQEAIKAKIQEKYKQGGLGGLINKGVDAVKGMVGMETDQDRMDQEVNTVMETFTPKKNYLKYPKIPLIQFDTYRFAGETYSRSVMQQSVPMIDDMNVRKHAITENSENIAKPGTVVDGNMYNETDAAKLKNIRKTGEVARLETKANHSLRESVVVFDGVPLPSQFFEDIERDARDLDNLWGHHEVSKGGGDPNSQTKGGILALQEADQTPVRLITRNLEDALQEVFNWVVQIRKLYMKDDVLDWSSVDQTVKVTVKSGSMMPVSKEQQRQQALELFRIGAIDPYTLHERLETPNPEQAAQRLQAWITQKQILLDGMGGGMDEQQKQRVMMKIQAIQQNKFDEVQSMPDDDPRIHHDLLIMALKSGKFDTEQEKVLADLIKNYEVLAQRRGAQSAPAPGAPAAVPMATPPQVQQ